MPFLWPFLSLGCLVGGLEWPIWCLGEAQMSQKWDPKFRNRSYGFWVQLGMGTVMLLGRALSVVVGVVEAYFFETLMV